MIGTNIIQLIILFQWICTPSLGLDNGLITHEEFCYEDKSCGPDSADWAGQCHGSRQSPIDLPSVPHRHTRRVELEFNDQYCNNGKFCVLVTFSEIK